MVTLIQIQMGEYWKNGGERLRRIDPEVKGFLLITLPLERKT
jgi:hypothetical protein